MMFVFARSVLLSRWGLNAGTSPLFTTQSVCHFVKKAMAG